MKGRMSDKERIHRILDAIGNIEDFTGELTYEEFMEDLKLRLAIVKLFEIIGESVQDNIPTLKKQLQEFLLTFD